jgi:hypothetical protein
MIIPKAQKAQVAPAFFRWRRLSLAETVASDRASAACYRRSENIDVLTVVVPELKFRDVQRQIFATDLVIGADNAALEDAPEAFNRVGVDRTDNVIAAALADDMMRKVTTKKPIAGMFIRAEQADLVRHSFMNEAVKRARIGAVDHSQHHVSLAADSADHWRLAGTLAAARAIAFVLVSIRRLAAHIGFVHLDNAAQLVEILFDQRRANAMAHIPSGFVRTKTEVAMDLPRAHSLFASEQQMNDAIPNAQIDVGILENGSCDIGEPIAAFAAIRALPFEFHRLERIGPVRAAARADHAVRPAPRYQIGIAGFLVGERRLKLGDCHLDNLLRLLTGHDGSPYRQGRVSHA